MAHPRICEIEGCGKRHKARGWCDKHYQRWKQHGDPLLTVIDTEQPATCTIKGCGNPAKTRRLCQKHYFRYWRHGDASAQKKPANGTLLAWMRAHVDHSGDDCLIWPYNRNQHGYGAVGFRGKERRATRVMAMLAHGEPPTPKHVAAHSCGNGHLGCMNPRHLRWATPKENAADRLIHGTHSRGERSWNAKLTESDVRQIRHLAGTEFQKDIAAQFGVHPGTVGSILRGKSWAWLS